MKNISLLLLLAVLYLAAFFLHFVWEMWQIPLYVGMAEASHWAAVQQCTLATLGDGCIALAAYSISAIVARDRFWLLQRRDSIFAIYIIIGLVITVFFEILAIELYGRWQYSELMPTLPVINVGLSPLLQWIIIPPVSIWISVVVLRGFMYQGDDAGTDQVFEN